MDGRIGIWIVVIAAIAATMILSGRLTARIAVRRGRSGRVWFAVGALLFLLFPLPQWFVELLPKK